MTAHTFLYRHLGKVRSAMTEAGLLRLPGGDVLERILDDIQNRDLAAARAAVQLLTGNSRLAGIAIFLDALLLDADDRRGEAAALMAGITGTEDTSYDILCLTGDVFLDWRQPQEARTAYDRAIALAPHASHAILRRGRALSAGGDATEAIADFRRATLLQPGLVEAHVALAHEYRDASMTDAAISAYRKALSIDPGNAPAESALTMLIASQIPPWHAAMLNDTRRNDAFDAAIRRAVERCTAGQDGRANEVHVLDIGTGTGLLAMMAVRAGAGHVTACETIGPLAEVAREVVARNGMADRITVIHKQSADLVIGEDLPRRADLLTAEIVDTGLLNEAILPTVADARARLLNPDARIIPCGATVFAVPVDSSALAAERMVDRAAGFDIAPFNDLAPNLYLQTDLSNYDWRPLSAPVELFGFDFSEATEQSGEATVRVMPVIDGTAHAIAFWFQLRLDDRTTLATGPMDPPTHWKQAVCAVNPPIELKQNEPVKLHARHDGNTIRLSLSAR